MRFLAVIGIILTLGAIAHATDKCDGEILKLLPKGKWDGRLPELSFIAESSVDYIRENFLKNETLVVTSSHFADQLHGYDVAVVSRPYFEDVFGILKKPGFSNYKYIIGLGGGVATDVAKAVAVGKNLYIFHTALTTNCISNNRTVLGDGFSSVAYIGETPKQIVLSRYDLMDSVTPTQRAEWTRAGIGDYVAELSAAMDAEIFRSKRKWLPRKSDDNRVINMDPEVWEAVQWMLAQPGTGDQLYTWDFMKSLARILHATSLEVIEAGTNEHRIGLEHMLYKGFTQVASTVRDSKATHGVITAIGSLIVAKAYQKLTGSDQFYRALRALYLKTGLPVDFAALQKLGITEELLNESLNVLEAVWWKHYIFTLFNVGGRARLVKETFTSH